MATEREVAAIVSQFPMVYARARADWAKFKAGRALFSDAEKQQVVSWFRDFPKLWQTISPNWTESENSDKRAFASDVSRWIIRLRGEPELQGLGLPIPLIIVAGILIAGTIASAFWAVEHIKKQNNLSTLIDGVVTGRVAPEVLTEYIRQEGADSGFFGGLKDVTGTIAIIAGLVIFGPAILAALRKTKNA